MNALAIHLYLIIRHINLSFTYFGNFYRIIEVVGIGILAGGGVIMGDLLTLWLKSGG